MASRNSGNAFPERTSSLKMPESKEDSRPDSKATTLEAMESSTEHASPTPPRNSYDQLVGPTTETERRGRSLVREQRAKMVSSLKSQSPTKQPRKRSNTETSKSTKSIRSERKVPQLFEKIKTRMQSKKSKANLQQEAETAGANVNKPLPALNVSATIQPADPAYSDIPNFLTMPSPSPRWQRFPTADHESPALPTMNPEARPFVPDSPAQSDWPLPSSSPMPAPQIVPRVAARVTAATHTATLPSGVVSANQGPQIISQVRTRTTATAPTATLPSGIVFANQGPQFLTPARTGTYTSVQKPVIVAAGPTHASMQASIVDTAPPTPATPAAIEEEDEEDDEEGEKNEEMPVGGEVAALRQEIIAMYAMMDARLGRIEGHLGQIDGRLGQVEGRVGRIESRLARVEGVANRVESAVTRTETRAKQQAAFGGRYPGDARDMLAFK